MSIKSPLILHHLQEKRSQILAIAHHHGAYNLRIFGSVARGEATPSSDIDILIDYDLVGISLAEQYRPTPWFPAELKLDLEALLVGISLAEQYRPIDIATPAMLKARNRDHILSEAIPL